MTVGPRWRCRQASRASPIDWERSDTDALPRVVYRCGVDVGGGRIRIFFSPKRPGLSFPGVVVEGHAAPRDGSGSEVLYSTSAQYDRNPRDARLVLN